MSAAERTGRGDEPSGRLDRRLSRVRLLVLGLEIAGLGAAVAGLSIRFGALPAVIAAGAAAVWLARLRDRRLIARRIETSSPSLDRALSAFAEGGGGALRDRLATWILDRNPRAGLLRSGWIAFAGILALAAAIVVPRTTFSRAMPPAAKGREAPSRLEIRATIVPPSYTGRPPVADARPGSEVLRGSTIRFSVATAASRVELQEEGRPKSEIETIAGHATSVVVADSSRSVRFSVPGAPPVVWPIRVVSDAAPSVDLLAPAADLATSSVPGPFDVRAAARDDIGLVDLAVRWTLAHGRGESMAFRNGRARSVALSGLTGSIDVRMDPGKLGMALGDTLVVWAEATDNNAMDGPGRGISPARIVRWEESLARLDLPKSGDPFRLADGLLSEREILARTLRLLSRPGTRSTRAHASRDLAADQRQLREAFSQFTQGESGGTNPLDVDAPEVAAQGDEQGRNLLAAAVSEMWSAERELDAVSPKRAVPFEKRAVKLLDKVFGGERLALRALAPPRIVLDPKRRLAGESGDLHPATETPKLDEALRKSRDRLRRIASDLYRFCFSGDGSSRELADEVWNAPDFPGLDRAGLAAPLYAAKTAGESAAASRAAADAVVRLLTEAPITLVPVDGESRPVLDRLEPFSGGRPRSRER